MSTQTTEAEVENTTEGFEAVNFGDFSGGDVLDTPSLELPKATPEVHEGTVISVTTKTSQETGNSYGVVTLQSKQTGLTYDFNFYPPQAWYDPTNWTEKGFNPETLSDVPPPGKKQTPKEAFARSVSSSTAAFNKDGSVITEPVPGKDAPLQLLRKLAAIDGLTLEPGTPKPTNGEEYTNIINSLVAGRLDILFTRRPEKNENPQFDGRLKVNSILAKTEADKANFQKRFKDSRILFME